MGQGYNPFAGLGKAAPSSGGNYVKPGLHRFKVKALKMIQSAQRNGSPIFIAELETLSSKGPDGLAGPHVVGSSVSWSVNFQHAPAMGNLKAFFMAVVHSLTGTPCGEADVDEGLAAGMVAADQPAAGVELDCEAFNIITKGKGQPFTKCLWTGVAKAA